MERTFAEDLDLVVERTGHVRFRELVDPGHPAFNPGYVPHIRRLAAEIRGEVAPEPPPIDWTIAAGRETMSAAGDANPRVRRNLSARDWHLMKVVHRCPHSTPCNCTMRNCDLSKGEAPGKVSVFDCLDCLANDGSLSWTFAKIEGEMLAERKGG